jgi:hypothetical protein
MEGFLTFLLVFFLIIWLLVRFAPYLLKWWIQKRIKRYGEGFNSNNYYGKGDFNRDNSKGYEEGDVYIKQRPSEEKIVDKEVGEYVDYEETK